MNGKDKPLKGKVRKAVQQDSIKSDFERNAYQNTVLPLALCPHYKYLPKNHCRDMVQNHTIHFDPSEAERQPQTGRTLPATVSFKLIKKKKVKKKSRVY